MLIFLKSFLAGQYPFPNTFETFKVKQIDRHKLLSHTPKQHNIHLYVYYYLYIIYTICGYSLNLVLKFSPVHLSVQEQNQSNDYIERRIVYDQSDKMKTIEGQYQ